MAGVALVQKLDKIVLNVATIAVRKTDVNQYPAFLIFTSFLVSYIYYY